MRALVCLLASMAGAVACGPSGPQPPPDRPRHPLLDTLAAPPLNRPVAAVPIPFDAERLRVGNQPDVLLLAGGRPFRGMATRPGRVTVRVGRIDVVSEGQPPVQILYRLPAGVPATKDMDASGSATLVDRSSPDGPDQLVLVRQGDSLLLAHVLIKSANPVIADLGHGLRLAQRPAPPGDALTDPRIEVLDGEQSAGAVTGAQPVRIETRAGAFTVAVESNRVTYGPQADPTARAYVLKAWVVRAEK